ncbi:MAG: leucine-rich repeat domain-containing protein [Treponema sp.]|nr:leucine-rich repeat domain-containing protein [Treponema sp.]
MFLKKNLSAFLCIALAASFCFVSCSKKTVKNLDTAVKVAKAVNGVSDGKKEPPLDKVMKMVKKAKPAEEKVFRYELTKDGSGVRITGLSAEAKGKINDVLVIPATIEGMPVKEIIGELRSFGGSLDYAAYYAAVIPEGVEELGTSEGGLFPYLKYISVPSTLKYWDVGHIAGDRLGKKLEKIDGLENSKITSISGFFCANLKTIKLPPSLKKIEEMAFAESSLISIEIPEGVTEIGRQAFGGCVNLEKVILPSTIKKIGNRAFIECGSLKEIVIPDSVKSIIFDSFGGPYEDPFEKTNLNLKSQGALKAVGYKGSF